MRNKILIYDDDAEILLLCKAILDKYKYTTETLTRCDNILSDIATLSPNLILMDLWIPEMGGEKAIAMAKQNEQTKHIPILVFSANADIGDISVKLHADGFVEKPFTINNLIETIQKHLS